MTERPVHVAMLSVHTCPLAVLGGKKTGGMNVYVRELTKELSRRGIHIDVFTRSQDSCVPHVSEAALGHKTRVIHIPTGPERPLSTKEVYPYLPEFVSGVRTFAAQNRVAYDLLHSHYWLSGWAALRLRQVWDVPVMQMFHTLGHMKNRIAQHPDESEPEIRLQTEYEIMRAADYLIAATPAERTQLMWLYGADMHKIRIIPPGVDLEHFYPMPKAEARQAIGVPEKDRMILFVGRIEPLKGIDTLLRAIAILKDQIDDKRCSTYLSIIGGDPNDDNGGNAEMQRLQALCQALSLDDLVTFLGSKSQETLQYYYAAADAVIMPSHYESFGLVALEAMACGTPVIASEVGGLAYLIQDGVTGFHVPDRDPEELAGRICSLLNNPALRQKMSVNAVKNAQQYSWSRVGAAIRELYSQALASKTACPGRVVGRNGTPATLARSGW